MPLAAADYGDLSDAVHRLDAFLDPVLCNIRNLAERDRSRNRNSQNRCRVGIQFLNGRLFGCLGQIWDNRLDTVLNLLSGDIDIFFENKLNENLRNTLDRR